MIINFQWILLAPEKDDDLAGKGLPKFDRPLKDVTADQGDDVTLYCNVSGEPFPEVIW